jgi:hypothetical protein
MKRRLTAFCIGSSLAVLTQVAGADVLRRQGEAWVLPEDGSGVAKVAVRFDLSGLREGSGLTVVSASVNWDIPGMPAEARSEFQVYRLEGSWGPLGPSALDVIEALDKGAEVVKSVYPQDHVRVGRRTVRLSVTDLTQEVLNSRGSTLNILVASPTLSRQGFTDALGSVHFTIRYGFLGEAAPLFRSGN